MKYEHLAHVAFNVKNMEKALHRSVNCSTEPCFRMIFPLSRPEPDISQ